MTDTELLANWLDDLSRAVHRAIGEMPLGQITWRPDAEANSIGVTVWHMARWLDVLATMGIDGRDAGAEQWYVQGWAERTGYDPRGVGSLGLGAVTGYTLEQVTAIPALDAAALSEYFEQVTPALRPKILALTPQDFERPASALGEERPRSVYYWIRAIMQGCFGHVGEIQALKAMYERARRGEKVQA